MLVLLAMTAFCSHFLRGQPLFSTIPSLQILILHEKIVRDERPGWPWARTDDPSRRDCSLPFIASKIDMVHLDFILEQPG